MEHFEKKCNTKNLYINVVFLNLNRLLFSKRSIIMFYLTICLALSLKKNKIGKKDTAVPVCDPLLAANLEGCETAYQSVLTELAKARRSLINKAKINKTTTMIEKSKSKISKKVIVPADLLAATNNYLSKCLLTACGTTCAALFDDEFDGDALEDVLTAANADFAGKCKPPTSTGGGGDDDGDDGGDDGGDEGFLNMKANALLLLISFSIGHLFF
jgi:hypothetical protein